MYYVLVIRGKKSFNFAFLGMNIWKVNTGKKGKQKHRKNGIYNKFWIMNNNINIET